MTAELAAPAPPRTAVTPLHLLLALAIVAIWGTNFAIMKVALAQFPPLLFGALRFIFCVLPGIFFLKRPKVAWKLLAAYGLLIGVGQFGLVYIAVSGYISPGLASLIIQLQVFFTILMSARAGEKVLPLQWLALGVAFVGLGVIAAHVDAQTTVLGLILMLCAATSWAAGNMVVKQSPGADMLAYIVWSSLFSVPPLILLSLGFDGPAAVAKALTHASWDAWAAVFWQSAGNTMFGFAAWGWLLNRYKASTIAPTALLVPVFGLGASVIWLHEPLPLWKLLATGLVIAGLLLNMAAGRRPSPAP
jgi:O-acetylserine/cysteine efflux transporter